MARCSTAVFGDGNVEITTLRRDARPTAAEDDRPSQPSEWRDDALEEAINALWESQQLGLGVDDYFGGLDDLAARRVRFIGDAATRIREAPCSIPLSARVANAMRDEWALKRVQPARRWPRR